MRVRRQPGIEGKLREMPGFVLEDAPSLRGKWQEYFGNKKPLYVELGWGKNLLRRWLVNIRRLILLVWSEFVFIKRKKGERRTT